MRAWRKPKRIFLLSAKIFQSSKKEILWIKQNTKKIFHYETFTQYSKLLLIKYSTKTDQVSESPLNVSFWCLTSDLFNAKFDSES